MEIQTLSPRIPQCANPKCQRRISAEQSFCPTCFEGLLPGTRDRIRACHEARNFKGLRLLVRRGVLQLRAAGLAPAHTYRKRGGR